MAIINVKSLEGKSKQEVTNILLNPSVQEKIKQAILSNPKAKQQLDTLAAKIKSNPQLAKNVLSVVGTASESLMNEDFASQVKSLIMKTPDVTEGEGFKDAVSAAKYLIGGIVKLASLGSFASVAIWIIVQIVWPAIFGPDVPLSSHPGGYGMQATTSQVAPLLSMITAMVGGVVSAIIYIIGNKIQGDSGEGMQERKNITTESRLRKIIRQEIKNVLSENRR